MKLVFQIAGGLLLFVVVMVVVAAGCLALVGKGISDAVSDMNATDTAIAVEQRGVQTCVAALPQELTDAAVATRVAGRSVCEAMR